MIRIPQEIRISSMVFSFADNITECSAATPILTIDGAVIALDGSVYKFSFSRGKICFVSKKDANHIFNKTVVRVLENMLEAYAHGTLKFNVIRCNFDDMDCDINTIEELELD